MIDLDPKHLDLVKKILEQHVPHYPVLAFGSRVAGGAKKYSDLDLVLKGEDKVPLQTLSSLKEAFAESNLPCQVDIVDWHRTSPEFRDVIMQGFLVLQMGTRLNQAHPNRVRPNRA